MYISCYNVNIHGQISSHETHVFLSNLVSARTQTGRVCGVKTAYWPITGSYSYIYHMKKSYLQTQPK